MITVFLAVIYFYLPLSQAFFQQDEWLAFGRHFLLLDVSFFEILKNAFWNTGAHFVPLSFLTINLIFRLFLLDFKLYVLFSILLHLINTGLVYILAKEINKDKLFSYLPALLFGIMAAGSQSTSWVVADISVHMASMFALFSLIFFSKFIQKRKERDFFYSLFLVLISLMFKEIALGLFVFYFLLLLFFRIPRKLLFLLISVGFVYFLFRTFLFFQPGPEIYRQSIMRETGIYPKAILINLVLSPINSLTQTLVPSTLLVTIAKFITSYLPETLAGAKMTFEYDSFILQKTIPFLSILIFLLVPLLLLSLYRSRQREILGLAFFSVFFVILNSLVYSFIPERAGVIYLTDSRNLYFVSVGTAFFIFFAIKLLVGRSIFKLAMLFIPFFILNVFTLRSDLKSVVDQGFERHEILNKIKASQPELKQKTLFYSESDWSFYGLAEKTRIFPFQSGFGQTLIVWYYPTSPLPRRFLESKYLWEIDEQGYMESEGKGFGYFRDFEILAETLKTKNLPLEAVIAYRYSFTDRSVFDITEEVRGRLEGYFKEKEKVKQGDWQVLSEINTAQLNLLKDGNRETVWSSGNPYNSSQFLTIKLNATRKIAQIRLDAYNNKDQNNVGYKIMLSENGEEWRSVFFAKKYPPTVDGITDLYLKPLPAKYIRIEQAGYHQFAPWVIHEMEIYETLEK